MTHEEAPLDAQLRELKYEQRMEQIALLSRHDNLEERAAFATAMIRELAMHRVFDRFTHSQQENLLDRLQPLSTSPGTENHPAFGEGAFSKVPCP